MRPERKGARDALKAIPTKAELAARLEASTLTDQHRQAVWLVYGEGMTRVRAAVRNLLMMLNGQLFVIKPTEWPTAIASRYKTRSGDLLPDLVFFFGAGERT